MTQEDASVKSTGTLLGADGATWRQRRDMNSRGNNELLILQVEFRDEVKKWFQFDSVARALDHIGLVVICSVSTTLGSQIFLGIPLMHRTETSSQ